MPGQQYRSARVVKPVAPDAADQVATGDTTPGASDGTTGDATSTPARAATARSGSLLSLTDRPVAGGLIALLAALAFVLARLLTWAQGSISRFILVGQHFATPAQLPRGIPVAPAYGYDGQFFYRLALDPLNFRPTAYGITIDQPYRFMRIGYPAVTWLVSLGQHAVVPVVLVAVNIATVAGLGWLGGVFARQAGRHALTGLLVPGYFGLITSLSRDTAEPLAAACLLGGLLAVRARRPVWAALLLTYGALTRETVMVAVAAIAGVRIFGVLAGRRPARPGRDDLPWLAPTAAFTAWQLLVRAVTGSSTVLADGGRNAGAPLLGPFQALKYNLAHLSAQQFTQVDLWFLQVAVLVMVAAAALACLRSTTAPLHERLALILFLVEICVVTPSTWHSLDSDLRSFIEVYLLAVIILLGTRPRSIGTRLLPYLAAFALPALIVVTERRLVGS